MDEGMECKYDHQVYSYYSVMMMKTFDMFNGKINSSFSNLEESLWFSKSSYGIYFYGNRCIIPVIQTVDELLDGKDELYTPTTKMELVYRILVAMAYMEVDKDRYPIKDHDKYVDNSVAKYVHDFMYAHAKDIHNITGISIKEILYIIYIKYYKYDDKYALSLIHIGMDNIILYMMRWLLDYNEFTTPENYERYDTVFAQSDERIHNFYNAFENAINDDSVAVRFIDSSNEDLKPFDLFWFDDDNNRRCATIDSYIRYISDIAKFKDDNGFNAIDLDPSFTDKATDKNGNKIIDFYI